MDTGLVTHFFFYGTLQGEHKGLRGECSTSIPGRLWSPYGSWPAATDVGDPSAGTIKGTLYSILPSFTEQELAHFDNYEGYFPSNPRGSFFVRRIIYIGGVVTWYYRFNQPLPKGAVPIPDGDYLKWREENRS